MRVTMQPRAQDAARATAVASVNIAPVNLREVVHVAGIAEQVVAGFRRDFARVLGDAEVHHIGATAMPFGHTKGDVDVNVRLGEERFADVVAALRKQCEVAQAQNWTPTYASFAIGRYALPLGVQVTVIGSADDFLLVLRDRMKSNPELLRDYDERKLRAAARGERAYWRAKNDFLRMILAQSPDQD